MVVRISQRTIDHSLGSKTVSSNIHLVDSAGGQCVSGLGFDVIMGSVIYMIRNQYNIRLVGIQLIIFVV